MKEEFEKIKLSKYQISHTFKPPFKNKEVIKYFYNLKKKKQKIALNKPKNFKANEKSFALEIRSKKITNNLHLTSSPRLLAKKVKNKNIKSPLRPLVDPDFNYVSMRKKIEQKIPVEKNEFLLRSFQNETEYQAIKVLAILITINFLKIEDLTKKIKSNYIWSGQDVLPLRLLKGLWSRTKINEIFHSLSTFSQDKEIWVPGINGIVNCNFF